LYALSVDMRIGSSRDDTKSTSEAFYPVLALPNRS
jgi:hypothetical protein